MPRLHAAAFGLARAVALAVPALGLAAALAAAGEAPAPPAVPASPETLGRAAVYLDRAKALRAEEKTDEALAYASQALAEEPGNLAALQLVADLSYEKGQIDEAETRYRELLAKGTDRGYPRRQLARILATKQDPQGAKALLTEQLTENPTDVEAHFQLGLLLDVEGDHVGALTHYDRVVALDPEFAEGHFRAAADLARVGDVAGAIEHYGKTLQHDDDWAEAQNNLAWLLATTAEPALRDGARAVELATRACEATKWQQPTAIDTLAAAQAEAGAFAAAVASARKAADLAKAAGNDELLKEIEAHLALFEAGKPFHEPPRPSPPALAPAPKGE